MSDECRKAFEEWATFRDIPVGGVHWNVWQAAWSARGNGWVSVKERLPEEDGDYLTFTTWGDVETNWWDNEWAYEGKVTHWQPLPEPPKGGSD